MWSDIVTEQPHFWYQIAFIGFHSLLRLNTQHPKLNKGKVYLPDSLWRFQSTIVWLQGKVAYGRGTKVDGGKGVEFSKFE